MNDRQQAYYNRLIHCINKDMSGYGRKERCIFYLDELVEEFEREIESLYKAVAFLDESYIEEVLRNAKNEDNRK